MEAERHAQRVVAEARKLAVDVMYSEKGHFAAADRWKHLQFWMGVSAAVLSGLAGASFLATIFPPDIQDWLPAALAFIASTITALSVVLKPDQVWEKHHGVGVDYGQMRRKLRHFVQIDCQNDEIDDAALSGKLDVLTEEVGGIQKRARPIPSYGHSKAKKEIASGHANYEEDELDAATGPLV